MARVWTDVPPLINLVADAMNIAPFILGTIVILALHAGAPLEAAAACAACQPIRAQFEENEAYKRNVKAIIEKNQAYLRTLQTEETSKKIKVNSNILIASIRVETADHNLAALRKRMEEEGCAKCPK